MQTKIKTLSIGMAILVVLTILLSFISVASSAMAATAVDSFETETANESAVEPYALFVDVVVALNGGNDEVWAAAQTKSAIFATSIYVVLELYSSYTYQDSYQSMTLEKRVSVDNLKKGEILKAVMPTNGEQKYWKGRMYYKADSTDWKYAETPATLFDANGIIVL